MKKGEFFQTERWHLGKVRCSVKGNDPTVFTLEVRYPRKGEAGSWQIPELVGWTFFLSKPEINSNDGSGPAKQGPPTLLEEGVLSTRNSSKLPHFHWTKSLGQASALLGP